MHPLADIEAAVIEQQQRSAAVLLQVERLRKRYPLDSGWFGKSAQSVTAVKIWSRLCMCRLMSGDFNWRASADPVDRLSPVRRFKGNAMRQQLICSDPLIRRQFSRAASISLNDRPRKVNRRHGAIRRRRAASVPHGATEKEDRTYSNDSCLSCDG